MFCINCGKELPEGAKFCLECGQAVPNTSASGATEQASEPEPEPIDSYALILLSYGKHFGKCQKAIANQLGCSSKEVEDALLVVRDNRYSGLVLAVDKPMEEMEELAKPFEELNCNIKTIPYYMDQGMNVGQIIDINLTGNRRPQCPVCGSTNIHRILIGDRILTGVTLQYNKRFHTFECGDCGYTF